ncbi:ATP-binding cassette sub-family A member 1-like [Drosophila serrata]|uniref:ATP-binding cassette sub-family A member 1-like n=1 Tax=Drosophila serrata TaxID=7274 RepID=UPI000A1D04B4|nr:ATP-binding cassette sub-family A member 1-like [Drosophila serrata]
MSSDRRSLDGEVYPLGDWQKLKILLWKNWVLQKSQKLQMVAAVLVPFIFIFFFIILRVVVKPHSKSESRYNQVPIDDLSPIMRYSSFINNTMQPYLCYTPDTSTNAAISKEAATLLSLNGSRPYASAQAMENDLMKNNYVAGVEFGPNDGRAKDGFPLNFTYSLRFPGELRIRRSSIIDTWRTNHLFEKINQVGPRNRGDDDGGAPVGYIQEGFLPVQHALAMSWLSKATRQSVSELPSVQLQRFPFRAYQDDSLMGTLRELLALLILLSFMYPCAVVTRSVAIEKELQLKEIMKMIGVANWLHWIAWFLKSYLMLMVVVVLYVIVFKVKFIHSTAIFRYSEWLPILVFLHTYVIASICFCFMLAVFFSKASTASVVTCILWYLTFIPFSFINNYYDSISLAGKLSISMIFSNTALGLGLHIIMNLEGTGMGATWISMFDTVNEDDDITLFYVILTLTMSALIYLSICLYVEQVFPGNYGIARKWNFCLKRQFWCESQTTDPPKKTNGAGTRNRKVGVELKNLQKTFGKFKAVKGLNLKMYRDEITVLLGHNGAGKTTTLHMLTGIIAPTAGTALINGYDIRTQLDMARQSLGICPQHNILFMKMSVRDHIVFFSKLKGVRGSEAVNREVKKYVEVLGLQAKSKVAAENLSGGMKRKLSLCCAMCGSARVVLCDEPSSGIDAAGRKSLWELLQSEKQGRTVLLTTHYMDEADVLGDRIAILSEGKLQCHGTSFYLKKRYGTGYQLVCIMQKDCNVDAVTELINRHLPYLKPEREMGTELTYRLPHTESKKFSDLLADLDRNYVDLKLSGYGLSVATLEDVFMEVTNDKRNKGGEEKKNATPDFQTLVFDNKTRENRFLIRCCMCFQALMFKKIMITIRNYWLTLIMFMVPVIILLLTTFHALGIRILKVLPEMEISPLQYKSSYVVLEDISTNDRLSPMAMAYTRNMERYGKRSHLLATGDQSIEDYILGRDEEWNHRLDYAFVAGLSTGSGNTTIWLNNKPLHTAPLTLNLFHNALARQYLGKQSGTYVTNKPLPYNEETQRTQKYQGHIGTEIGLNLALAMCFVTAFFALPIIKERETRAKLLQFLSGVDAFSYWTTMFIWDFLIFAISALMAILTLACFQEPGYKTVNELGRNYALLLIFGIGALPVSYFMADCFTDTATGFVRIAILNLITGCGLYIMNIPLDTFGLTGPVWVFRIFPHFCLANGIRNLFSVYAIRNMCESAPNRLLQKFGGPNSCFCCNLPDYFAWKKPGILPEIVYLVVVGIFLFLFVIIHDTKLFQGLGKLCKSKKRSAGGSSENPDVVAERTLVRELLRSRRKQIPLLVDNVRKQYKKKLAVRGVSFHVGSAECFGLLGINGAGKTSVFKMLTGDHEITSGDAYIDGFSVSTQMRNARHKIGYCPQFDAIFEDLTGTQNLRIYCLLRGVQRRYVKDISWTLARAFGFENHMNKQSKHYSGGNKRKLSTAIAILGNPSVVFLDEPTSGMDPGARRNLWQIMDLIRTAGKSLVLTSHSMDECEALCTRLTIMVDGQLKCIGSTQSLKTQYAKGLILKVKVKTKKKNAHKTAKTSSASSASSAESLEHNREKGEHSADETKLTPEEVRSNRILNVNTFVLANIPDAELKDEYNGLLTYFMPQNESLSRVFKLIEENQKKLYIEDYLVTQTRLEEVFLDFASNCETREADVIQKKRCCC